jgi:low affinity Fe/Cu permease
MADEKFDEKEHEKQEEKSPEEKHWDEKSRRDPLSAVIWAAILVWAGLVLLANNLGFLDAIFERLPSDGVGGLIDTSSTWSLILLGAGVIVLLEVLVRLLVPDYRRPVGGSLILAVFLIGVGLSNFFSWNLVWPFILIGIGIVILLRSFLRNQ